MTPVHLNFACVVFSHPLCERRRLSLSQVPVSSEVSLGLRNLLHITTPHAPQLLHHL